MCLRLVFKFVCLCSQRTIYHEILEVMSEDGTVDKDMQSNCLVNMGYSFKSNLDNVGGLEDIYA